MTMAAISPSPSPTPTHTSLLTAQNCEGHIHLILGDNPLAAARTVQSLSAGAKPILIAPSSPSQSPSPSTLHPGLAAHIASGALTHLERPFAEADLFSLGRPEVDRVVDAVFIVTGGSSSRENGESALDVAAVSRTCRRNRIPVNVVDAPALCSFALLSVHAEGPLQIGVTTNGQGCKLASRIRREVAAGLPAGLGGACRRLGEARRRIRAEDGAGPRKTSARGGAQEGKEGRGEHHDDGEDGTDDSFDQTAAFNKLVTDADADAAKTRRMRWLTQVCEYWPLKRLAAVTDADVDAMLQSYAGCAETVTASAENSAASSSSAPELFPARETGAQPPLGRVILAGSGPGHPDLLTRATYKAIQAADLVLADKLVPAGVLDLVPRRTPVVIARKFPGNADAAQEELLTQALAGLRAGQTVLRLKQGDPFVYGRGGEEAAFFAAAGMAHRVHVLPGITSALSAPLFAGVPATQRDVADQVLVCTGTGKKGKPPAPPEYVPSRTVVFLMALHRIEGLVAELTTLLEAEKGGEASEGVSESRSVLGRRLWPLDTPCAVIERASCPDQRIIRTTLRYVVDAIEQEGSRPPGLLVVGNACEVLHRPEEGKSWSVEDGFKGLDLDNLVPPGLAALG